MENLIRTAVFHLPADNNNTDVHDIPANLNRFDREENISIKITKSKMLYCGGALRFFSYDFTQKHTIIALRYQQSNATVKRINHIYELEYDLDVHKILFGSLVLDDLLEYINYIKNIPHGTVSAELKREYKQKARELEKKSGMSAKIAPKVDSKTQRRVQITIPDAFELFLKAGKVKYTSVDTLRETAIPIEHTSEARKRTRSH